MLIERRSILHNVPHFVIHMVTLCVFIHFAEIIKTDIVSIDLSKRRFSWWSILVFFVMLCLLLFIFIQLFMRYWQQRKHATLFCFVLGIRSRYDLDDLEKIGLLRRRMPVE